VRLKRAPDLTCDRIDHAPLLARQPWPAVTPSLSLSTVDLPGAWFNGLSIRPSWPNAQPRNDLWRMTPDELL
jgi:hypothetical protein